VVAAVEPRRQSTSAGRDIYKLQLIPQHRAAPLPSDKARLVRGLFFTSPLGRILIPRGEDSTRS
jgi:hypothetical protein